MEHCDTCLYREEGEDGSCPGYAKDDEGATARAESGELSSDIRLEEQGEAEGVGR